MKALSDSSAFCVLVVCHTLSNKERAEAVKCARLCWAGIRVLFVAKPTSLDFGPAFDQVIHPLAGPTRLLQVVSELLGFAGTDTDPGITFQ